MITPTPELALAIARELEIKDPEHEKAIAIIKSAEPTSRACPVRSRKAKKA